MKIYNRKEFMKLPPGIIFSSSEPFCFMDLYVKGETWKVDFLQSNLIDIESFNSDEHADRLYEMEKKGASYSVNKSEGREGLFDDDMLYLVYEKDDLQYMIELFQKACTVC